MVKVSSGRACPVVSARVLSDIREVRARAFGCVIADYKGPHAKYRRFSNNIDTDYTKAHTRVLGQR